MTDWSEGFVAVDWGTTNRRAYLVAGGRVLDEMEDDQGVTSVPAGGFGAAVADLRGRFGDRPLLLAGMVGSDRGWVKAPYVACPATLDDLAGKLCWVEPGRAAIVPGLSFVAGDRADVMRGEEVQIFGVAAPASAPATICHPGTHTKWIGVEGRRILGFRTIMTGELFALLRDHSILAPLLGRAAEPGEAFLAGVDRGFASGAVGAEMFTLRARVQLGLDDGAEAASFGSGVLIGCDVRIGLAEAAGPVTVVGRPSLTGLYAAAIRRCGGQASERDGAAAFVAGMQALAEKIR